MICHSSSVEPTIRSTRPQDVEVLVALSSRAWQPVFTSVNEVLGRELARLLHGEDWRDHHAEELREILSSDSTGSLVVEVDGELVGFVAARVVDPIRRIGEVQIVGVDPSAQRQGVGTALIRDAEIWLHRRGMKVAFIGTGGDPGHAPARRLYESLGYTLLPSAQYFRVLRDEGDGLSP
jgi:GNAT superfamily N-acetyltransferase